MIILSVVSYNGAPVDGALQARFDELGGSIGRADTNTLVLPDPDRTVSRVHAQLVFRSGSYALIDRGSNPVSVNGQPLGNGREAPVRPGDEVQIGGYVLRVAAGAAAAAPASDPFADLLGPASSAPAAPGAAPLPDPLASLGFGAPAAAPSRPAGGAPSGGGTFAAHAAPAASAAGGIPDDWDPFAPDPAPPAAGGLLGGGFGGGLGGGLVGGSGAGHGAAPVFGLDAGARPVQALIPDMPSTGASSIDQLFGLGSGGGDPLAGTLFSEATARPNMANDVDPLRSLGQAPKASASTASDAFSDLQQPFQSPPSFVAPAPAAAPVPALAPAPAPRAPATPADRGLDLDPLAGLVPAMPLSAGGAPSPAPAATPSAAGSGQVLSWEADGADGHTVIRPAGRASSAPRAPAALAPQPAPPAAAPVMQPVAPPVAPPAVPPVAPAIVPAATPQAAQPAPQPAPAHAAAGNDALLQALREGLDTPSVAIDTLDPQLMRLLGVLLRESIGGTVDLLVARAAVKREVQAEATMIVARDNNPLKFSPSGEVALQHLLRPPARGFMEPGAAMRDAYHDLRAHQLAMVAGMRAALEGVLGRFEPSELEGRLVQGSGLRNLLPGSRKARMWEVFTEFYTQIRNEASDDFQKLFGKAFLEAYERQLDELERGAS